MRSVSGQLVPTHNAAQRDGSTQGWLLNVSGRFYAHSIQRGSQYRVQGTQNTFASTAPPLLLKLFSPALWS